MFSTGRMKTWGRCGRRCGRKGKRAVRQKRLERYTEAFLTDDRSYEDNAQVATQNQRRDAKRFVKKQEAPGVDLKSKKPPIQKKFKKQDVMKDDRTSEEKEAQIPKSSELSERIEEAQKRVDKVLTEIPKKRARLLFQPKLMETPQRRMLFMNPGTKKLECASTRSCTPWSSQNGPARTQAYCACKVIPSTLTLWGSPCPLPTLIRKDR